ncbi:putative ensconsin-like [Cocos nucifera]|nr:putative ensconsin-like [Cocos nucifera]
MDRIVGVDFEQHTWDSLGTILEMGHQLIADIKMISHQRLEVEKVQEDHQAEIDDLLKEKSIEVEGLQETIPSKGEGGASLKN